MNIESKAPMDISHCSIREVDEILALYQSARDLQSQLGMVVWPHFERIFIEDEIAENRQWKILVNNAIACNWAITFADKEIWGENDRGDSIYIHRICTNPVMRGNRFIDVIVEWARTYATTMGKRFIRLDTLGNNVKLIAHYTSAGFEYLGMIKLTKTDSLPLHYQNEPNCCLFEIPLHG